MSFETFTDKEKAEIQTALIVMGNLTALANTVKAETLELAAGCGHLLPEYVEQLQAAAEFCRAVRGEKKERGRY
jgi:hypothetical protein